MTWRQLLRGRSPLARRLVVCTVLFSSAITLALTLFQLYRDYRLDVSVIESHLDQVERVHLPTIAESLWATDQNRLQLQLEGILQLGDMHFIELREGDYVWARAGRLESANVIRRQVPVVYMHEGRRQILGTLTVVATLDDVYKRLLDKAVTILVSNAIKTFLVALFMLMLFYLMVTRHLQRIGQWLAQHEKDSPPITLDKTISTPDGDEIDVLARTLNEFRDGQAQALEAAATEHKRYESLFDNANDMVTIVEPGSWRILDANRRASEYTGYTRDELRSMTLIQLGPPESAREVETALRRLSTNGSSVYERAYRRKDGSLFPVEVSGRVVQLGEARVIENFVRDLTERHHSEQVLRERDEVLRLFVEHSPAAIAMLDSEMRYVAVSRRWMIDYGLGDRDIIGHSHYEIFPEIPQRWKDIHQRCLAGATERCDEDLFIRADGQTDWVKWEICPWRRADGEIGGVIMFTELATERKQVEAALRQSEDHFRTIFEQATDGILIVDAQTRYLDANSAGCQMLGYSREELLKLSVADTIIPDEVLRIGPEITRLQGGNVMRSEWRLRRRDGSILLGEIAAKLLPDGRMQAFLRDITERQQADDERKRLINELMARNVEMESFVYTISHDLKAPLITISGFAVLLAKDIEHNDKERVRDSIREIKKAVDGMQQLIEGLLMLSRTGQIPGEPEDVDLHALLSEVQARCASYIERERATIRVVSPLPRLHVDRPRFSQVLQNLLDNGIKFHRTGVAPVVEIGAEADKGGVRLYVRDNGIGVEKRYQEKIFGLFERLDTEREGTGVGLTIARRIVEQHGGRLWIESEPGGGSTFWISLPDSVIVNGGVGEFVRDISTPG